MFVLFENYLFVFSFETMSDIKWANFQLDVGMASSAFDQMGLDARTQYDVTLVVWTSDGFIITRQFGAHLE